MAVPLYELLLVVLLITFQRTTCQQGDEESPYPYPGPYPGPAGRYPGPGGGEGGGAHPGGARGGAYPESGGGGMLPPLGPDGFPGSMGRGPGFPPQEPGPSSAEEGGKEGTPPPIFYPDMREDLPWPNMEPEGRPQQPVDDNMDQALGHGSPSDLGPGEGAGPSINEGTHQESNDHSDATGIDGNGSNAGTNADLTVGKNESVKSQGIRQNITVAGTPDDDFNYVGMYITVAVCITFMVTLVAIALIRGPQGPFKTKRTDEEIERDLAGGPTAEDVFVLSDGATTRTDAQWEQQPLRDDCNDVKTDVQVSGGDTAVASEGSTTVAVTDLSSKGEGV